MLNLFKRAPQAYEDLSPDEAADALANKTTAIQLVDVRTKGEFARGHLPGAKLMPLAELGSAGRQLRLDKPVLVYCASGSRSRRAASMLVDQGFADVRHMAGGIARWHGDVVR